MKIANQVFIEENLLNPGETMNWSRPRMELPGHGFGMVANSENEPSGGDAALHVLEGGAHNAAVWITKREARIKVHVETGSGYLTVMNLFSGRGGTKTFDLIEGMKPIVLGRADVHSYINPYYRGTQLVIRDEGMPALELGDEQSILVDSRLPTFSAVGLLKPKGTFDH